MIMCRFRIRILFFEAKDCIFHKYFGSMPNFRRTNIWNNFLFALHKPSRATQPHISSRTEAPNNEQIIISPLILATLLSAFQQRSRAYDETRNFERIKFNDEFRTNKSLLLAKFGSAPLVIQHNVTFDPTVSL